MRRKTAEIRLLMGTELMIIWNREVGMKEIEKGRYSKASFPVKEASTQEKHPALTLKCIAVIARDSLRKTPGRLSGRKRGFWPLFSKIAREASKHGADVLMFSLCSHDEHRLGQLSKKDLFPSGTEHLAVVLGVQRRDGEDIEVWNRSRRSPFRLKQYFAKVSDPKKWKKSLIQDLPRRRFGHTMLLLCGEVNIVRTHRDKLHVSDDFHFRSRLRHLRINLVLNPSHTYMHRPEMASKRRAISRVAHNLISVWNRGDPKKGSESKSPWIAYRNGKKIKITEIPLPVELRHGIRMGMITL